MLITRYPTRAGIPQFKFTKNMSMRLDKHVSCGWLRTCGLTLLQYLLNSLIVCMSSIYFEFNMLYFIEVCYIARTLFC